jgi:hypothetical protein
MNFCLITRLKVDTKFILQQDNDQISGLVQSSCCIFRRFCIYIIVEFSNLSVSLIVL